MNKTRVIELAKQAGIETKLANMGAGSVFWTQGVDGIVRDQLERFYELAIADYIKRIAEQDKLLEQALVALKSTGIMWPIVTAAIQAIEGEPE